MWKKIILELPLSMWFILQDDGFNGVGVYIVQLYKVLQGVTINFPATKFHFDFMLILPEISSVSVPKRPSDPHLYSHISQ